MNGRKKEWVWERKSECEKERVSVRKKEWVRKSECEKERMSVRKKEWERKS